MHAFAIDGWEPISSYHRHCDRCLVPHVRWHIENTGFHQWTTLWCFAHVFVRDANGMLAILHRTIGA